MLTNVNSKQSCVVARCPVSSSNLPALIRIAVVLALFIGCSAAKLPYKTEQCKIRTYVDVGFVNYLSSRYDSRQMPRIAVIPFDIPENFAAGGLGFSRELASSFQRELLANLDSGIVEMFDRDRWPGKRAEFFTGNDTAIQLAREAGYDFVIVGVMEELKKTTELSFFTKAIDTSNGVTVWSAETTVSSSSRDIQRWLSNRHFSPVKFEPEQLPFVSLTQLFSECTVSRIVNGEEEGK